MVPMAQPLAFRRGTAVSRHICFISVGTPGKVKMRTLGMGSQIMPGAVPTGLGKIVAPSGWRACLRLF